ncbi:MAG: peptidoglycan-binding domain-containing protein [Arenicellales bacterium]
MKYLMKQSVKRPLNLLTVIASITLTSQAAMAQTIDNTTTLPNAKAGECYAKVITPTQYKTETQQVTTQQGSESIEIIPAKYQLVEERVLVKQASTKVVPVAAVYGTVKEKVETSPASQGWFSVASKNRKTPANPILLEAMTKSGIELSKSGAGVCFKEHYIAATYRDEVEKVLISQASEKIEAVAAVYEMVEERVLVKEASTVIKDIAAVFETVEERVMVEPAKSVWKKGRGLVQRLDNNTGEIMCLVEVPAKYKVVATKVLKTPATTKVVEVPAEYKIVKVRKMVQPAKDRHINIPEEFSEVTKRVKVEDARFGWFASGEAVPQNATHTGQQICNIDKAAEFKVVEKRVVKTPASFNTVNIPAEYKVVEIEKLVSPATEKRIKVPAITQSISKQVKVSDSRLEWRRVLCETNMTKGVVTNIQKALTREGYDVGPADGVIGGATLRAVESYQIKHSLDRGGLTYETLDALKVGT